LALDNTEGGTIKKLKGVAYTLDVIQDIVIMTARKGTELPFDFGDIPAIFWEIQDDLKEGLRKGFANLKRKFGR
jgi:hypothetical protein